MKNAFLVAFTLFTLFLPLSAAGHDDKSIPEWMKRFKPYGINYAIWNFAKGDEQALEVNYSFKYLMYDCKRYEETGLFGCKKDDTTELTGFFSYTGNFDFYMFTRESSPVTNRTSNPALHINYEFNILKDNPNKLTGQCKDPDNKIIGPCIEPSNKIISSKWIDLAFEHRSNGQVVSADSKDVSPASPTFGQFLTEIEYRKGNREYFDRISRDANYINLAVGQKFNGTTNLEISAKLYVSDNADITWGKYAGTGAKFKDFDLVKLKAFHTFKNDFIPFFPETTVGLEYLIGRKGLKTDSIDLYLLSPFISYKKGWEIPLMVKAHFGPMASLSDYARNLNSVGIGVVFFY